MGQKVPELGVKHQEGKSRLCFQCSGFSETGWCTLPSTSSPDFQTLVHSVNQKHTSRIPLTQLIKIFFVRIMWISGSLWKAAFLYLLPLTLQIVPQHGRASFDLESLQNRTIPLTPTEGLPQNIWFYPKLIASEFASDQFAMLCLLNDFRTRKIIWGKAFLNFLTWQNPTHPSTHLTLATIPHHH